MSHRAREIAGSVRPDRWMAEIKYFDGTCSVVCFEEIEDLDEIVESGPDWNEIDCILVTLNRPSLEPK